jgi:cycloeucalenol cycloisomerase
MSPSSSSAAAALRQAAHLSARDPLAWTWALSRSKWDRLIFSNNFQKAWCERFFLAYSLVWPLLFGLWSVSGLHLGAGDAGNMLVSILIGSPFLIVPWLYQPRSTAFYKSYAFKFNLWIAIYAFVASYFFSEYFFDVLGMKYSFPHLSWNLDSVLVGQGMQRVPLMMYVHAWYFFMTYHTGGVCFIRFMRNLALSSGTVGVTLASVVATFIAALVFAIGEIYFTTLDAIKDQFAYRDMSWALTWGGFAYSCYFLASFPMVKDMDEKGFEFWQDSHFTEHGARYVGRTWKLRHVVENALAAGMLSFILLDVACQWVLPRTWYHEKGWWL